MKPVKATVKAIFHFLLFGQLCGFCGDVSKDDKAFAASFADCDVTVGRRGGSVGLELAFEIPSSPGLVELLPLSRSFIRV